MDLGCEPTFHSVSMNLLEELFEGEQRMLGENYALLHESSLANLRKYRYSSVDLSPTSKYFLNPYVWTPCSEIMPRWLAPNCITLIGISTIISNLFLVLIYIPDFESQAPSWVYLWFAFSLFFYQTMDNVDGKQARRTGSSSPLGELFDHGIDSLNCCWAALVSAASFGLGATGACAFVVLSTCIAMFTSTWETYFTHTLFLGYLNGPTEGLLITAGAHVVTAFYGVAFWETKVALLGNLSLKQIWVIIVLISVTLCHIPGCVINVMRAFPADTRGNTISTAVEAYYPLLALALACFLWLTSPVSTIISNNHIFMFGMMSSFVFGRITTAVILAHLCWQPVPLKSSPMALVCLGGILYGVLPYFGVNISPIMSDFAYLKGLTAYSAIYFTLYATLVVEKITTYLGISAFTIPSGV